MALRLAKSPEDVATEGLVYVLGRSAAARALVQRMAGEWVSAPLRPIVSFRSQVASGDNSRPDLEAHDAAGIPVVVFENKFWAGLTTAQPVAYLQRLTGHGGVLCFVAPTARLHLLWPELTNRAAMDFAGVRVLRDESELKVAYVREDLGLVVVSWSFLLGQLRTALEAQGESSLVADVRQLMGLAARMDTMGFIPLTVSDITAPTARHVMQFCDVVNAVVETLLRESFASKRGLKATAGEGRWGHYLLLHGLGCELSFNAPMWAEHGRSPIWLCVASPKWQYSMEVERAMTRLRGRDGCVLLRDDTWRPGVWMALNLPVGRERDDVVADVFHQVVTIANALQEIAPPGVPVEAPPEPEAG